MQSKVGLARVYGERMGHLSRHGHIKVLCKELEEIRPVAQQRVDGYAFRKAFIGAGGSMRDWERLVAPVIKGSAARASAARTAVAESEDDSVCEAPAELPVLQEAVDSTSESDDDPWAGRPCERVPAANGCSLTLCEISDRTLGVRVHGVFGAGGHGGGQLIEQIREALDRGVSVVVLDLSGLQAMRIDSTGPLVACQVSVERVGGRLVVVTPGGAAGGLLQATGLTQRMTCFDDVTSAMAELGV